MGRASDQRSAAADQGHRADLARSRIGPLRRRAGGSGRSHRAGKQGPDQVLPGDRHHVDDRSRRQHASRCRSRKNGAADRTLRRSRPRRHARHRRDVADLDHQRAAGPDREAPDRWHRRPLRSARGGQPHLHAAARVRRDGGRGPSIPEPAVPRDRGASGWRVRPDGRALAASQPPRSDLRRNAWRIDAVTRRTLPITIALAAVLAVTALHAQQEFILYLSMLDTKGNAPGALTPEELMLTEGGQPLTVLKVEKVDWPVKVQVLVDNGVGLGSENLIHIRNGVRDLIKALPPEVEVSLYTTAPQPRAIVRPTMDRLQLIQGADRI